jgi:hypothetical protein
MNPPGHRGYSAVKGILTSTGSIPRFGRADESDHLQSQAKSSMKGLDTNALVRYLTQDDPKQAALASNGQYENSTDVGMATQTSSNTTSYTLRGLTSGQTDYIAVTAYDKSRIESNFSNEVSGAAAPVMQ